MKKIIFNLIIFSLTLLPFTALADFSVSTNGYSIESSQQGTRVKFTLNGIINPDGHAGVDGWFAWRYDTRNGGYYDDCKDLINSDGTHVETSPITFPEVDNDIPFTSSSFEVLPASNNYDGIRWCVIGKNVSKRYSGLDFFVPNLPSYVGPMGYKQCALENKACSINDGLFNIAYGVNGNYIYKKNISSDLTCNNATFGQDPAPGSDKACFTQPVGPEKYSFCSYEGEKCTPPSRGTIAYGTKKSGSFVYKSNITTSFDCKNSTFGKDPAPGDEKACFFQPSGPTVSGQLSLFSFCALEGESCTINGTQEMAYGANNSFIYKTVTATGKDVGDCSTVNFGSDPLPGIKKACFIKASSDAQLNPGSLTAIGDEEGPGFFPSPLNTIHNVMTGIPTEDVTDTSVTIYGSANPKGKQTWGYFRYSTANIPPVFCNQIYGSDMLSTFEEDLGYGNNSRIFHTHVTNLTPNTTYYYCAVASEKDLIEYGAVGSFITMQDPSWGNSIASIVTKNALVKNDTSAYLNGTYTSAIPSTTWFEYRKKKSYLDLINSVVNQATASISGEISLLSPFNLIQNIQQNIQTNSNINSLNTLSGNGLSLTETTGSMANINNLTQVPSAKPATQISSIKPTNPYQWVKVNIQDKSAGTNGKLSYDLKNLSKDTTYEFRAAIEIDTTGSNPQISYGDILSFKTSSSNNVEDGTVGGDNTGNGGNNEDVSNLNLGDTATPPDDAVVHYHEGIEHVLVRQLMRDYNRELIEKLGYQDSMNLETFAWDIADFLARTFGYVSSSGKEIRVGPPDRAAYRLVMIDGKLTIYEYFDSKIVAIQDVTSSLRKSFEYEYYYTKKVSQ